MGSGFSRWCREIIKETIILPQDSHTLYTSYETILYDIIQSSKYFDD